MEAVARLSVADGVETASVEIERSLGEQVRGDLHHCVAALAVLCASLVQDRLPGGVPRAGVLLDVLFRLQEDAGLLGQARIGGEDDQQLGLAGVLSSQGGDVAIVGMFAGDDVDVHIRIAPDALVVQLAGVGVVLSVLLVPDLGIAQDVRKQDG